MPIGDIRKWCYFSNAIKNMSRHDVVVLKIFSNLKVNLLTFDIYPMIAVVTINRNMDFWNNLQKKVTHCNNVITLVK